MQCNKIKVHWMTKKSSRVLAEKQTGCYVS